MIWFDLWLIVAVVLSLGGHTDTYRTVVYDGGAFELCLPSLPNLHQITQLRTQYLGVDCRSTWSWGEDHRLLTQYALRIVWVCVALLLGECVPEVLGVCEQAHYQDEEYRCRDHCVCI